MVECPRCGSAVGGLQPVPPNVLTPEVVEAIGRPDDGGDVETCEACIEELTEAA